MLNGPERLRVDMVRQAISHLVEDMARQILVSMVVQPVAIMMELFLVEIVILMALIREAMELMEQLVDMGVIQVVEHLVYKVLVVALHHPVLCPVILADVVQATVTLVSRVMDRVDLKARQAQRERSVLIQVETVEL